MMPVPATLLEIKNLTVSFKTDEGLIKAVENVSLAIEPGEIVGLVGESGCGKSVTALSILRLIPSPPADISTGEVWFKGRDLLQADVRELYRIRGRAISIIFQEPMAALSPLHRIGHQMVETLRLHTDLPRKEAWVLAEKWLGQVNIADARERMHAYPFQLSGGMQQRIMIAMALMLKPELIIADEPTTALDVTIQAQVFKLIKEMRQKQTSILLITHDMGVIWEMCDRVVVMYASEIVEKGSLKDIFTKPAHPYTRGLLQSIPKLTTKRDRLQTIAGYVPSPLNYPSGCHFRDRCAYAFKRCQEEHPPLKDLSNDHQAACFLAEKLITQPI
jgi:peptide/nickel transport system ATP-binding protein/oligopeptide transport system ATP-binding protein